MSRRKSKNLSKGPWRPCRMCPTCGRLIVRLPIAGGTKTVTIYVRGWDMHPWYVPRAKNELQGWDGGNAVRHPDHRKRRGKKRPVPNPVEGYDRDEYRKNRAAEKEDPFFSLDGE